MKIDKYKMAEAITLTIILFAAASLIFIVGAVAFSASGSHGLMVFGSGVLAFISGVIFIYKKL